MKSLWIIRIIFVCILNSFPLTAGENSNKEIKKNSNTNQPIHYLNHYQIVTFTSFSWSALNDSDAFGKNLQFRIQIHAYEKNFTLILRTDARLYDKNFELDVDEDTSTLFKQSHLVTGFIDSDPLSHAYGYVYDNGTFQGVFYTNRVIYYVELAYLYLPISTFAGRFLIYRDMDVVKPSRHRNIFPNLPRFYDPLKDNYPKQKLSSREISRDHTDGNKTTCLTHIEMDSKVVQRYGSQFHAVVAISVLLHGVNEIFRKTDFDNDGKADGVGFALQLLNINYNITELDRVSNPLYYFNNWTANYNYSNYCMAFLFIDHTFQHDVSGIGSSGYKAKEGICTKYYYEGGKVLSSSNVGLMSITHHRRPLLYPLTERIVAHEIGHIFGAYHDNKTKVCAPGGADGNYLMYPDLTTAEKVNNFLFSPCSKQAIYKNLLQKAVSVSGCFVPQYYAVCGNGIVDEGEECDCGYKDQCKNSCCTAAIETYMSDPTMQSNDIPCRKNSDCKTKSVNVAALVACAGGGLLIVFVIVFLLRKQRKSSLRQPFLENGFENDDI